MKVLSPARWLLLPLAAALLMLAYASPTQAQGCQFVLGFLTIQQQIPDIVGSCVTNETHDMFGNANQMTTRGMMQWRRADNFTAFTDGFRSWVNGPCGLEMRLNTQRFPWEANPDRLPVVASACGAVPPPIVAPPAQTLPAPIIDFVVDTNPIVQGECTRLRWDVEFIDSVWLDGQGVTGYGVRDICPRQETTYTLDVRLRNGSMERRQITVRVVQSPDARIEFWADDFAVFPGSCTTLRWRVENIDQVFLDGQGVVGQGTRRVCPAQDTTYTLEVRLRNGNIERRQVTVRVASPR